MSPGFPPTSMVLFSVFWYIPASLLYQGFLLVGSILRRAHFTTRRNKKSLSTTTQNNFLLHWCYMLTLFATHISCVFLHLLGPKDSLVHGQPQRLWIYTDVSLLKVITINVSFVSAVAISSRTFGKLQHECLHFGIINIRIQLIEQK